ncbi:MAG TPA: HEAT repeat domain-containing protein [Gallionella sp.]|nr:HEAT repeat domain-containing protein [Gallionella sp.]
MSPVLQRYLDKVIKDNRTIDARGVMQVNRMIELTMEEVYIHLSVRMEGQNMGDQRLFSCPPQMPPTVRDTLLSGRATPSLYDSGYTDSPSSPCVETGVSSEGLWARHNAWVLLGDPGAGKTTLLKHFALRNAQDYITGNGSLPILLPLRLFATEWELNSWTADAAVLNYLGNQGLTELGFELEQEREELLAIFKQALNQGRALLLFDGLDEQRNADMQRKTVTAIEALYRQYPGNRYLVSSRIIGYDAAPLGSAFNTATLEPFNDEQMEVFFRQWLYAVERQEDIIDDDSTKRRAKEKADELIQQIKNNSGIRALATNPLLCTIIGLIRRQGATLPQLRAELYKLCIDTFIFNWELQKRRRPDQQGSLNKEQTQAILEELALHFHEHCPENRASQQTITEIIRDFLVKQEGMTPEDATHKAGQLLSLIRDVSGLLIDRGNNEYGFFHLTFQEYLTARAITRRKRDIDRYLEQHLVQPRWREVILLAAAHQGMKDEETGSEFIEAILRCKHPREEIMHYAFRLAFLCMREARVELETSDKLLKSWIRIFLEQPELDNLLLPLLHHSGTEIRYRPDTIQPLLTASSDENKNTRSLMLNALALLKDNAALPILLAALEDENELVRWSATNALASINSPTCVPALLGALKDKESFVRWGATRALGECSELDPATTSALLAALKDSDALVRWGASEALSRKNSPTAISGLLNALKNDDCTEAALILSKTQDSAVITELIDTLDNADKKAQQLAILALIRLDHPIKISLLLDALKHPTSTRRSGAAAALTNSTKEPKVLDALLVALKDESSEVRSNAAGALLRTQNQAAIEALLIALKDENSKVRSSAASALRDTQNPAIIEALLIALKDENSEVRSSAASALGDAQNQDAIDSLLIVLKDEDRVVRNSAIVSLSESRNPAVVPALHGALKDSDKDVRLAAVNGLANFKNASALIALLDACNDEEADIRRDSAKALREFNEPAAKDALLKAIRDENGSVRASAAKSLETFQGNEVASALIAALKDDDGYVRHVAFNALGEIREPAIVRMLIDELKNESSEVRYGVVYALGKIKPSNTLPSLIPLLRDADNSVRQIAAWAIEQIDLGTELCPD